MYLMICSSNLSLRIKPIQSGQTKRTTPTLYPTTPAHCTHYPRGQCGYIVLDCPQARGQSSTLYPHCPRGSQIHCTPLPGGSRVQCGGSAFCLPRLYIPSLVSTTFTTLTSDCVFLDRPWTRLPRCTHGSPDHGLAAAAPCTL